MRSNEIMVNRNHYEFKKYEKERNDLIEEYSKKIDKYQSEWESRHGVWRGKDSPWGFLEKELTIKLRKIQTKYYYLFEPDIPSQQT